jgi:hypothetical protein
MKMGLRHTGEMPVPRFSKRDTVSGASNNDLLQIQHVRRFAQSAIQMPIGGCMMMRRAGFQPAKARSAVAAWTASCSFSRKPGATTRPNERSFFVIPSFGRMYV